MKKETVLKLVIPGEVEITIEGKTESVTKYFNQIRIDYVQDLGKRLKEFEGKLVMRESQRKNTKKLTADIIPSKQD